MRHIVPRHVERRSRTLNLAIAITMIHPLAERGAGVEAAPPQPIADPVATVVCGHARFTMLTDTLVRLEWSADKAFEDRASYFAVNRRVVPVPKFKAEGDDARVQITSPRFQIQYTDDGKPFGDTNLRVKLSVRADWNDWQPGAEAPGNLLGTMRTLDSVSGATELEPGLLTRAGWTFLDDSRSILFDNSDWPWAISRELCGTGFQPVRESALLASASTEKQLAGTEARSTSDWYLFVYGDDYPAALRDLIAVGGRIPMPPRYAFGGWWSRYWEYSDGELRTLVGEFRAHGVPLDVLVIDMDWHLDGWTGYTWNPAVFPDPQGFLRWCHEQGLKVPLNLHPADGVHPHERAFEDVCRALGHNPQRTAFVPFDCTDKEYMCSYFEHLHHPLQREGVDFWWIDWQQGRDTRVAGLDPLPWLNHLHWEDQLRSPMLVERDAGGMNQFEANVAARALARPHATVAARAPARPHGADGARAVTVAPARRDFTERDGQQEEIKHRLEAGATPVHRQEAGATALSDLRRPLIFSRWGGLGNHRYQIGFSGDTFCDWESLAFQPYFTATAGNVGYAYWSHDIGGHQPGPVDPELYTRWIQWGALSPILRTHTTKNPAAERRIWGFPPEHFAAMKAAWLLRYELIPYLYTAARQCYETGLPLCRPLYYEWPTEKAYEYRNVYMLGDDLLVAPITSPAAPETGCATAKVWIPPGEWVHWYTGQRWKGPRELRLPTPLDQIPLFVRAGAVIPASPPKPYADAGPDDPLRLRVFQGLPSTSRLYEDDGNSRGYEAGAGAWTELEQRWWQPTWELTISPRAGDFNGARPQRNYELIVHDVPIPQSVRGDGVVFLQSETSIPGWSYDDQRLTLTVRSADRPVNQSVKFRVDFADRMRLLDLLNQGERGIRTLLAEWRAALGPLAPRALSGLLDDWGNRDVQHINKEWLAKIPGRAAAAAFAAGAADTETARRNHFLTRVFGLSAEFEQSEGDKPLLQFVAMVNPPLSETGKMAARVTLRASGDRLGEANLDLNQLTRIALDPLHMLPDPASDVPQPTLLTAAIELAGQRGERETIEFTQQLLPSINAWWLAGPFESGSASALDAFFSALTEIDASETWPGKSGGDARWHRAVRAVARDSDLRREFFVAFRDHFGQRPSDACAYAVAFIESESAQPARLALGSDDGNTAWLNGEQVFSIRTGRAYQPRQQQVDVELRQGRNVLVLRVDQQGGDWGFSVFLEDREGRPLPNVRVVCPPARP